MPEDELGSATQQSSNNNNSTKTIYAAFRHQKASSGIPSHEQPNTMLEQEKSE